MNIKKIVITTAALAVMFGFSDAFASTNVSIYESQFGQEGFVDSFFSVYKNLVIWALMINVLISLLMALFLLTASDKDKKQQWKSSLINVNASFLTLALLGGLASFAISTVSPSAAKLNKANQSLTYGGAFNDTSPSALKDSDTASQVSANAALLKAQSDLKKNLTSTTDQKKINEYLTAYSNVYNAMALMNATKEKNLLSNISTAFAKEEDVVDIQKQLERAKSQKGIDGNPLISDSDIKLFNEAMKKANQE